MSLKGHRAPQVLLLTLCIVSQAMGFQRGVIDSAPKLVVDGGVDTLLLGGHVIFMAHAQDAQDGDLTHTVSWFQGERQSIATGSRFTLTPTQSGVYPVEARVTDSRGNTVSSAFVVTVPADKDSDGDGLYNGEEVKVHGTNPHLADSDNDSLPDGFEVRGGTNPNQPDAQADPDADGYTNHQEFLAGTDPMHFGSTPGVTLLNENDKHPSVILSEDRLGVSFTEGGHRGVRSDVGIVPGSGFYYYEGRRSTAADNFGFGVASSQGLLDNYGGSDLQSLGVNALGGVAYGGPFVTFFQGEQEIYGFAVDYRGEHPVTYVLMSSELGGTAEVIWTQEMTAVSDPLYVLVYGNPIAEGVQQTVNTGNDLNAQPFVYDVVAVLTAAGVEGADQITLGWREPDPSVNRRPRVSLTSTDQTVVAGETVTVTATASDEEDGDLTAIIAWTDDASAATGTGGEFSFQPTGLGDHLLTATVTDTGGESHSQTLTITVTDGTVDSDGDGLNDGEEAKLGSDPNDPDTDDDGLNDGAEVNTHGTSPISSDSDNDLMPDGYEVQSSLNPLVDDAAGDADNDTFTNLAEFQAGTDPQSDTSFPGAAGLTFLNDADRHSSVVLSEDKLGVEFTASGHHGVRSDQAIEPGSGFYYYEGRREIGVGNYGFGVATAAAILDNYGGADGQGLGLNVLGGISMDGEFVSYFSGEQSYYGFAVDYRGINPVIHVITSEIADGPGVVLGSFLLEVEEPLHILVYGNPEADGVQQTINPGNDVSIMPFHFDAARVLEDAGVAGVEELLLGWNPDPNANRRPQLSAATTTEVIILGDAFQGTATASDPEDGDLSASIHWLGSPEGATGTGPGFSYVPAVLGIHDMTVSVSDAGGATATVTLNFTVIQPDADTDGDGLIDSAEITAGTDPTNPDTDGDNLSDGLEVLTYGTNPLDPDSDLDQMPDGYEVDAGLDPLLDDGDLDADNDTFTNFQEFQAGTDPQSDSSFPGADGLTFLSNLDRHESVELSTSRLGARFTVNGHKGVRSDVGIQPGSGFFYYEGTRLTDTGNFGFGVATTNAPLDNYGGATLDAMGINALGGVSYGGEFVRFFSGEQDVYGLAVDYRGANPVVYVVFSNEIGGPAELIHTITMTEVTAALHVLVYGNPVSDDVQQVINSGNDLTANPFTYDVIDVLMAAGVDGAAEMTLGWRVPAAGSNTAPLVSPSGGDQTITIGDTATFNATATDAEDGDLTHTILWRDAAGPDTAVGGVFSLTPTTIGEHVLTARVIDSGGLSARITLTLTVEADSTIDSDNDGLTDVLEEDAGTDPFDPDSDDDGLSDGEEVLTLATNPLSDDTDGDLMPDGFEVSNGLNASVDDAAGDLDGDGATNLEEYQGGTDPQDSDSYPGAPGLTLLNALDRDPSVVLTSDRLGVTFTAPGHRGIRSDTAVAPGSGIFYYEGRREIATGNYGFGVATAAAPLDDFGGSTAQSVGVNVLGGVAYLGEFVHFFSGDQEIYGLALDYRGKNPIVHFLAAAQQDGAAQLIHSLTMDEVTQPVHIYVYGNPVTDGVQQTINPGNNLTDHPFVYDPVTVLAEAGIEGADTMIQGWSAPPEPENITLLSDTDRDPSVMITGDQLGAWFTVGGHHGVRSDKGLQPGSGFYYYEGTRLVGTGNYGFGVATPTAALNNFGGAGTDSVGVNTLGGMAYDGNFVTFFPTATEVYGLAVDYRGVNPVVHLVLAHFEGGPGVLTHSLTMTQVTEPLHILVYGNPLTDGEAQQVINPGNDLGNVPFHYDIVQILQDAGIEGAADLILGWNELDPNANRPPRVTLAQSDMDVIVGVELTLTATAEDREDGDITAAMTWSDSAGPDTGAGGSFTFTPSTIGDHVITAQVLDSEGLSASATLTLTVTAANEAPTLSITSLDQTVTAGDSLTLFATANDREDGDVSGAIQWTDSAGPSTGTGGSFNFSPTALGIHVITATVTDASGVSTSDTVVVTVLAPNDPPTITLTSNDQTIMAGTSVTLTATAADNQDGDLSSQISWTDNISPASTVGASFTYTPTAVGAHTVTAAVSDSAGEVVQATLTVTVVMATNGDSDGDGLIDEDEETLGTDPNNPDTDGDGLLDGAEVNSHGTNPLSTDSDSDLMPDGFEITHGLNALLDDAAADADADTFSNLAEFQAGTDPNNPTSFPGAENMTRLSDTDKHASIVLTTDRLGVTFTEFGHHGVRSDTAVEPGAGFFYFEGIRNIDRGDFGFGVATATTPLDTFGGSGTQSLGVNTVGGISHNGEFVTFFSGDQDTYGIAVDYRGDSPTVYVIMSNDLAGAGQLIHTQTLTAITEPVHILCYGNLLTEGVQQRINPGNDLTHSPFRYDVAQVLENNGIDTEELTLSWHEPDPNANRRPRLTLISADQTVIQGTEITLSASAEDREDGDVSAAIQWSDSAGPDTATGGAFTFTPMALGIHTITATVADAEGEVDTETLLITVNSDQTDTDGDGLTDSRELALGTDPNDSDSDDDGLLDGAEVDTHLTDPLLADSDLDLMPDGFEISASLNPLVDDAALDPDDDDFSNLEEFLAGTDPQNALSYPGAPNQTLLSDTDKHPSVSLTSDRLGVIFNDGANRAVRSDTAVNPGSGFYYFEGRRHIDVGNFGFGVGTANAALDNFAGADNQSIGILALRGISYEGSFLTFFSGDQEYYGIALDYRGSYPIVHFVVSNYLGGPGEKIYTAHLTAISEPMYIMIYGTAVSPTVQQSINPGNDLVNRPFNYDIRQLLADVWIGGTVLENQEDLVLGWNRPPTPANLTLDQTAMSVNQGASVSLTASALDFEGTDISADIQWRELPEGNTGSGGSFTFTGNTGGIHTVTASVTASNRGEDSQTVEITVLPPGDTTDSDGDGLTDLDEINNQGTDPHNVDSDGDGSEDGAEVSAGTNPLVTDSDGDLMADGYELRHGLNALVDDASGDPDSDTFTNLQEFEADTDPNSDISYPGRGVVVLNPKDAHPAVTISGDGLGVTFNQAGQHGVRSDVAVQPGSGWFYYEGTRTGAAGDFGFGIASAAAPLDEAGGANDQSIGIDALGRIFYGGSQVDGYNNVGIVTTYGVAVDYSGANPIVHFLVDVEGLTTTDGTPYGAPFMPAPITMSGVTGAVHIYVYGDQVENGVQQTINAGADQEALPFHFPAHYHLFTNGQAGAEFMGLGWGPDHAYSGRETVDQFDTVVLVNDETAGDGIYLSHDGLTTSYSIDKKMAIRANQAMIGEFRYWESRRDTDLAVNLGQGFMTEYGVINDYCCVTPDYWDTPPSMSINSLAGVWRNLVALNTYDVSNTYYGFACDYRGSRPIIYCIVGDVVIATLVLDDIFTPIYPMVYGNPQGDIPCTTANFGASDFHYNAKSILDNAGVDTTGLVLGWGDANRIVPALEGEKPRDGSARGR